MAQAWQCISCGKLYPLVGEYRSQAGHGDALCAPCSTAEAATLLAAAPPAVVWYVDRLKAQIKSRDAEIRDAVWWCGAEYETRGGSW